MLLCHWMASASNRDPDRVMLRPSKKHIGENMGPVLLIRTRRLQAQARSIAPALGSSERTFPILYAYAAAAFTPVKYRMAAVVIQAVV